MSAPAVLNREVFRTSRELEYFTQKELTLQTGHESERWPEVVLKELIDNGLDACESAGVLPEIKVAVDAKSISVSDNGSGIPESVIASVLDFSVRASSKDAYISPTRGAQGNALKTVVAIPYVLSGCHAGGIEVRAGGKRHVIETSVDRIAQRPVISHGIEDDPVVKNGTFVKVLWPDLAPLKTEALTPRFLQLLAGYSLFNPHASFEIASNGEGRRFERSSDVCGKWLVNEPTSAFWYTPAQLRALIAAYITAERHGSNPRTVREFVSEFRGLTATAKQKAILGRLNLGGVLLHDLVEGGDIDRELVERLLAEMQAESKPVKPQGLGVIGEAHFRAWFEARGVALRTLKYQRVADVDDESKLPFVMEFAFAARDKDRIGRQLLTGINWSPALVDPFRSFASYGVGLNGLLSNLHVYPGDDVTFVMHLACPHLNYTDRGKSSLEVL